MSKLLVDALRHTGASADGITLDSSGNVTFPGNATVTGSATGFGGVTEADQWRFTSNVSGSSGTFTANWARNDDLFSKIGTGLTESSGIFSFPSTGIYFILFIGTAYAYDSDSRYISVQILGTHDNGSNYTELANSPSNSYNSGNATYSVNTHAAMFDVTDTSNCKIKFDYYSKNSVSWVGDPYQKTGFTSIRLGDT